MKKKVELKNNGKTDFTFYNYEKGKTLKNKMNFKKSLL